MSQIIDKVLEHLPKHRKTPSGWISFNAVCCHHRGEGADKRGRAGIIIDNHRISYSCFNCKFKASWRPGRTINFTFRKFLEWLGIDENVCRILILEALRLKDSVELEDDGYDEVYVPDFPKKELPNEVFVIPDAPDEIQEYAAQRHLPLNKVFWSNQRFFHMRRRIVIPFTWQDNIVGYTARAVDNNITPKYKMDSSPGYVYGVDLQEPKAKFAILTEGPLDAICINGIASLGNELNDNQVQLIDTLDREIILVPDRGIAGQTLIDRALETGYSVSFPEWEDDVKDVNDAVIKYGKLFTLYSILRAKHNNRLKINILRKKYK